MTKDKWHKEINPWFEEDVINVIKEALEQPAQEPMAWMNDEGFGLYPTNDSAIPLYTHPVPSWQGLTDDEIRHCLNSLTLDRVQFARAIEQALKEKNS